MQRRLAAPKALVEAHIEVTTMFNLLYPRTSVLRIYVPMPRVQLMETGLCAWPSRRLVTNYHLKIFCPRYCVARLPIVSIPLLGSPFQEVPLRT